MIRINLLGVERQQPRKTAASFALFDAAQRTTFACCLVLGLAAMGMAAWYWSLSRAADKVASEIAAAQAEIVRLQPVLAEVARAEERRAQLKQRVDIIEELRQGQSVPVKLLDHVSRSLPDMLWLTALDQKADAVNIEGRTATLISLADFVANLGTNKVVSKPIDIVNSEVEASTDSKQGAEVIKFSVKAPLAQAATPPAAGRGAVPGAPGAVPPAAR
jgi:type IV pilus assembly protein PilN